MRNTSIFVTLALFFLMGGFFPRGGPIHGAEPLHLQPITPGLTRFELQDADGRYRATGILVDLTHSNIETRGTLSSIDVQGLETISQIVRTRNFLGMNPIAAVGFDREGPGGLPEGLMVDQDGVQTRPGDSATLFLTRDRNAFLADARLEMELLLKDGTTIPVNRLNERAGENEVALYTSAFGTIVQGARDGVEVRLDLYSSRLVPHGMTLCAAGRVRYPADRGLSGEYPGIIPYLGYLLYLPEDLYTRYREQFRFDNDVWILTRLRLGVPEPQRFLPSPALIEMALSGGPWVLAGGEKVAESEEYLLGRGAVGVGIDPYGRVLSVAALKGLGEESILKGDDVARCLSSLGASDGILLPGGGKSPIWVRGEVINPTGEAALEPPVATALLVYSRTRLDEIEEVEILPGGAVFLPLSATREFRVLARDAVGNSIPIDGSKVSLKLARGRGQIIGNVYHAPERETDALITAEYSVQRKDRYTVLRSSTKVFVRRPVGLSIHPDPVILNVGESLEPEASRVSTDGARLDTPSGEIQWSFEGDCALVSPSGRLVTVGKGVGRLVARLGNQVASARVYVGRLHGIPLDTWKDVGAWESASQGISEFNWGLAPIVDSASETSGILLEYDFTRSSSGEIQLHRFLPLGGTPYGFRLQVYGDGGGGTLRARIRDNAGVTFRLRFQPALTYEGEWKPLIALMDSARFESASGSNRPVFPISFESLVFSPPGSMRISGRIGLGRLDVLYLVE